MIIKNTQPNVKHILSGDVTLTLLPGVNDVEPAIWAKARENYIVGTWIKSGAVVEGDAKKPGRVLSGYSAAEAVELVDACVDKNLLLEWQAAEKRGDVLAALAARLKAIEPDSE